MREIVEGDCLGSSTWRDGGYFKRGHFSRYWAVLWGLPELDVIVQRCKVIGGERVSGKKSGSSAGVVGLYFELTPSNWVGCTYCNLCVNLIEPCQYDVALLSVD